VRTFLLFGLLAWVLESPLLAALMPVLFFGGSYLLFSRRLYRWRQRWHDRARARHLEATLAVNPEDAKARSDLGGLLARRDRFAEALPHLEKAIRRSEDLPGANFYLGWALLNQGDRQRGRKCIETALAIDPRFGYGEPHLRLGDYFFARREYREAIPHYEACREIHGSGMEGAAKLGDCHLAVGEKEKAASLLGEALSVYRILPWFGKQERRGWARKAKAVLRRARVR
jgi:tetratricopeptide (TPR) repeat protein